VNKIEILERDEIETLYLHNASLSTLTRFINPRVHWVWILGHMPNTYTQWWQACIPITKNGDSINAEFRLVSYDLMLSTTEFLAIAPKFENYGLVLIQSYQRMPDTLDLSRIPDNQQVKILRSNGAFPRIYLPHAVETAQIQCFEKGYLASITIPN